MVFDLSYQSVYLGSGTGPNTHLVLLCLCDAKQCLRPHQSPGKNNITLSGVLVPQTTASNLAVVSQLFTNFLNYQSSPVLATGKSTIQSDGATISWLSQGIESLKLTVPFQSTAPINPIRSIDIGSLALTFTPETAWNPRTDSNSVHASMGKSNNYMWLGLMNELEYRTPFWIQRIDLCYPKPVQYRQEWFECRWAFYGNRMICLFILVLLTCSA